MSEKGLKALLATVIFLFLIWGGISLLPQVRGSGKDVPEPLSMIFPGDSLAQETGARFTGPGGAPVVALSLEDGVWRVNGYQADSATVARFWDAVDGATVGDLVATNPANHPRMGVSADSAWTLEVQRSGNPGTVLVGGSGPGFGTSYVRLPDSDPVYLVSANLRPHLTRNVDGWRSKRLARLDTAQVQRLEIERNGDRVTLLRSDSLWAVEDGSPADESRVRSLLGELTRLDASGFFASTDTLPSQEGSILALGSPGDTLLSLSLGTGSGDRWARVPGDSIVYRVPSWRADRVLPEPDSLRARS